MADLISRAAALEHMKSMAGCATCDNYNGVRCRACIWGDAMNIVEEASAVDAVLVAHGRWIEIEDSWGDCHYQCSECGEEWNLDAGTPVENNMNFCPRCGAKMDGERRDEDAAG